MKRITNSYLPMTTLAPAAKVRQCRKIVAKTYLLAGHAVEPPRLAAGLHLVATPIGNLRDITLRALETLAAADLIACEDTRVTRQLLDHYGIATPLTPYHEHNAAAARPKLLARLAAGEAVALVSDAGTPLVSDPGFKLVRAARDAGHHVTAAARPIVRAGGAGGGGPADRPVLLRRLSAGEGRPAPGAHRRACADSGNADPVRERPRLAARSPLSPTGLGSREAAICRELTKLHEEVRRGTLAALAQRLRRGRRDARRDRDRGRAARRRCRPADAARRSTRCCGERLNAPRSRTRSARSPPRPAGRAARSINARSRSPAEAATMRQP